MTRGVRPRHSGPLLLVLMGGLLATACQPTPGPASVVEPGPFGPPFDHFVSCSPPGVDQVWFGGRTLTNAGSKAVTIDAVRLENAQALTLADAQLVPDVPVPGRFFIDPNPAKAFHKGQWGWKRRLPAVGATIPPGETYELVFRVKKHRDVGGFIGVTVDYHDQESQYQRTDDRLGFMGVRDCRAAEDSALASLSTTPQP